MITLGRGGVQLGEQAVIRQRKQNLLQDIRQLHVTLDGPGRDLALSQRELSARYQLSGRTVSLLLQQLVQEGVLHTIPRVGTFFGRPPLEESALYLFVTPVVRRNYSFVSHIEAMHAGFADGIAQQGGATHSLSLSEVQAHVEKGTLPAIAGMFFYDVTVPEASRLLESIGCGGAYYGLGDRNGAAVQGMDSVDFDDAEGGLQATRHLLAAGHRNIAFVGLHAPGTTEGLFAWSARRETGWRQAMALEDATLDELCFLPGKTSHFETLAQLSTALGIAEDVLRALERGVATAVVAANVNVAQSLLQALPRSPLPRRDWPAIVCFDDEPQNSQAGISFLRLPWEKIGAEAAHLLVERRKAGGQLPFSNRLVRMNLIPRLTCRADWAQSALIGDFGAPTEPAIARVSGEAARSAR